MVEFTKMHPNSFFIYCIFMFFCPILPNVNIQTTSTLSTQQSKYQIATYKNIYKIDTFAMNDTIATVALYFILKMHDTHARFQFVFRYSLNIYSISAGHIHAISMNTNFQANEIFFLLSPLNFEPMLMIVMKFSGTTIECYPCFDYFVNMKVS